MIAEEFSDNSILRNRRKAKIERKQGEEGTCKRGELPTRDTLRARFVSEHEQGQLGIVADTIEAIKTWARVQRVAII